MLIDLLEPRRLLAAALVEDLTPSPASSDLEGLLTIGDTVYFTANDGVHGRELWRTDGTAEGTRLVKDIHVGPNESRPGNFVSGSFVNIDGTLYFNAYTFETGTELWKSDGTAEGTVLVKDLVPGTASSTPGNFTSVNGTVFFTANYGLWKTDGTAEGTVRIKEKFSENGQLLNITPTNLTSFKNKLFFTVNDGVHGLELWSSDGTEAGTTLFMDFLGGPANGALGPLVVQGDSLLFSGNDFWLGLELFKTDGTPEGTSLVKNLTPGGYATLIPEYFRSGGELFFSTKTDANVYSLWKTDGTSEGTILLKQFDQPGMPRNFANLDGTLMFFVSPSSGAPAADAVLWKSNGTPEGTGPVKTVGALSSPFMAGDVGVANGRLFFFSQTAAEGYELWTSDGTAEGTGLFRDLYPGPLNGAPRFFATLGDRVLFRARDASTGFELWTGDGTVGGTHRLVDIRNGSIDSALTNLTADGDKLYFSSGGGINAESQPEGVGFYVVDNLSLKPTRLLASTAGNVAPVGDTVFFSAYSGSGEFLYKTDGTVAGTVALRSFYRPNYLVDFKGTLFFNVPVGDYGLWKSDGTAGGTVLVKAIVASRLVTVGDTLFFQGFDDSVMGLYKSDGTSEGTILVRSHARAGQPRDLANVDGVLYYLAGDSDTSNTALWKSDGTEAGTVLIKDIDVSSFAVSGDTVYFAASDASGPAIWKSGGTPESTTLVKSLAASGAGASNLTIVGNRLFFTFADVENGRELWTSDGTAEGTRMVRDLHPGSGSSNPSSLITFQNQLYFVATDPVHGMEMWRTDGTAEGTVLVPELVAGTGSSAPNYLTKVNNALYFSARDMGHGQELFRILPPVANAGGPYKASAAYGVRLDASASFDPDPTETLSYEWDFDKDGQFDDATGPYPVFLRMATTGNYPVSVRVTNSAGLSSVASTIVVYDYVGAAIRGTAGDDIFVIQLDSDGTVLKLSVNAGSVGARFADTSLASITNVRIEGFGGRDRIIVDAKNGQPLASQLLWVTRGSYVLELRNATRLDMTGIRFDMSGAVPIATLDIGSYPLFLSAADPANIESLVRSARNNGLWDGPGLTSSSVTSHSTIVIFPEERGLLMKLSYHGDVNGDGVVNALDYFVIDSNFLSHVPGRATYLEGDLNYDRVINALDYFLIDSAFLAQSSPLSSTAASSPPFSTGPRVAVSRRVAESRGDILKRAGRTRRKRLRV